MAAIEALVGLMSVIRPDAEGAEGTDRERELSRSAIVFQEACIRVVSNLGEVAPGSLALALSCQLLSYQVALPAHLRHLGQLSKVSYLAAYRYLPYRVPVRIYSYQQRRAEKIASAFMQRYSFPGRAFGAATVCRAAAA